MRAPRRRALAALGAALAVKGVAVDWVTDRSKPFSVPFDVFAADGRLWIAPEWEWSEAEERHATRTPLDIKGANWAGFQQDGCPHELYKRDNSVAKYVKFLEDNGFNAVRLPLGAHWVIDNPKTGDNCGSYSDTRTLDVLDSVVAALRNAGIFVMFDMHNLVDPKHGSKHWRCVYGHDDDDGCDPDEDDEQQLFGAWTVLARVDASRPASSSDAGDGETERGRGRTLKLALVRGESEETRQTATVVERERWKNVRDEDEVAPGAEVFVARAVFERRRAGAVAMANDGEVAPAPADARASRARAREKRARAATLAAARGDAESEISAKAPKFIEFDALKPIEIRVKAPKAEVSAAARRLAETSLAAPKPPATASKASTPGASASASSSTETTDAAAVVRKKPSLPPRRAPRAPPPGFGDA